MTRPADKIIASTSKIDAILENASAGSLSSGNIGFGSGGKRKEMDEDVLLPPEEAPEESQTGEDAPSEKDGSNAKLNSAVVACIKVCDGCDDMDRSKVVAAVAKKMGVDADKLKKAWSQFDECDKS